MSRRAKRNRPPVAAVKAAGNPDRPPLPSGEGRGEGTPGLVGRIKTPDPFTTCVCLLLVVAVAAVFGQTAGFEFVNFDDNIYVYDNPQVQNGLTAESITWAFTTTHAANWHPLAWLSHMLDCQLFGLWAGGHHATNVLLHAATAVLLFLVLRRMTGDGWSSALVAAVFALHPLRAESVAWVAERKDVLSGFFFVLTLAAYAGYVRRPFSWTRYLLVVAVFALGLMAKPMLVTLPFVLLLLDYWPLGRWSTESGRVALNATWPGSEGAESRRRLILEKLPLLALAAVACTMTLAAQETAIRTVEQLSLPWRVANAVVAYADYLAQFFYPAGLAVLYPHPATALPAWKVVVAGVALAAISAGVLAGARKGPYLAVGWLWYVGMLMPVIGLVQVGNQAMADRYTYLPQIGLAIGLVWGGRHLARRWPSGPRLAVLAAAVFVAGLALSAWQQTTYWQDSVALWSHTIECTGPNPLAQNDLGNTLARRRQLAEAVECYRAALAIRPDYPEAHYNLGHALARLGRLDEAATEYQAALDLRPRHVEAHVNLGMLLASRGRVEEAQAQYRVALEIDPHSAEAHNNLGVTLAVQKRWDDAVAHYREAAKLRPYSAETHNNLGNALAALGRGDEAISEYQLALACRPDYAEAHNNLGYALAAADRWEEAIAAYRQAVLLKPDYVKAHINLGNALTRRGMEGEAIGQYREALQWDPANMTAKRNLEKLLEVYRGSPEAAKP